jgi:hypothetical protein
MVEPLKPRSRARGSLAMTVRVMVAFTGCQPRWVMMSSVAALPLGQSGTISSSMSTVMGGTYRANGAHRR